MVPRCVWVMDPNPNPNLSPSPNPHQILPARRWHANGKLIQQRGLTVSVTFG